MSAGTPTERIVGSAEETRPAGSWPRLLATVAAVVTLSAVLSHLIAAALSVGYPAVNRLAVRPDLPGAPVAVLGSSITLYGVGHEGLASTLGRPLREWFVPSGSPAEIETLQSESGGITTTVVGVSMYDMNELVLADRRPELVPLRRATADLLEMNADWVFTKRILSQYLLHAVARVFPVAGKSDLVMVGLRNAARAAAAAPWTLPMPAAGGGPDSTVTETIVFDPRMIPEAERTLDAWPTDLRLRTIANYRAAGRDRHAFFGPKWLALRRLTRVALQRGTAIVILFPVSPLYTREFVDTASRTAFEREIEALAEEFPAGVVLRMDREHALQSDAAFRDPVHLGPEGRRHVTEAVAARLLHP
jgi:hypothetical protein